MCIFLPLCTLLFLLHQCVFSFFCYWFFFLFVSVLCRQSVARYLGQCFKTSQVGFLDKIRMFSFHPSFFVLFLFSLVDLLFFVVFCKYSFIYSIIFYSVMLQTAEMHQLHLWRLFEYGDVPEQGCHLWGRQENATGLQSSHDSRGKNQQRSASHLAPVPSSVPAPFFCFLSLPLLALLTLQFLCFLCTARQERMGGREVNKDNLAAAADGDSFNANNNNTGRTRQPSGNHVITHASLVVAFLMFFLMFLFASSFPYSCSLCSPCLPGGW